MNLLNRKFSLLDGIRIPLQIAPFQTAAVLLYTAVKAGIPALNVGATSSFVDTAIEIVSGKQPFDKIIVPLILVLLVITFNTVTGSAMNFIHVRLNIRLREPLRKAFLEKRARLAYEHIENPEDWDLIIRASATPEDKLIEVMNNLLEIATLILSTISVMAILVTQIWWAGLLIIAVSIPLLILSQKGGRKSYDAEREITKIQRKYNYLFNILTNRDAVLERAMFGYSGTLEQEYGKEFERARLIQLKTDRKYYIRTKIGGVLTALVSILTALVLVPPVLGGAITVGMFISLVNAMLNMAQSMSWGLAWDMQMLARNREYAKDLTSFFSLSEQPGSEALPSAPLEPFQRLEFRQVTFRYPGMESDILKNLSFVIERGRHYSFVGVNGAGKTTITKLIMGLYPDYKGEILLNGRELRGYEIPQLKAVFCGVFQDFAKYSLTVEENIALGDARLLKDDPIADGQAVCRAAALAGLSPAVERLPKGFRSSLGKLHEDGVDLSGGEWQRLAMARAIISPAEVKILDEPTAALDPIAESKVYENFKELIDGKTTLFISHRLGSTLLADTIYVLSEGGVVESGSHKYLMGLGGLYSAMFESQRSWYL